MENNPRIVNIKHRLKFESFPVVSRIARGGISHLKLEAIYDTNGEPMLVVYKPGEGDDKSQRVWRQIVLDSGTATIRTPKLLQQYIGERMAICVESGEEVVENELFRLRPFFDLVVPGVRRPKKKRKSLDPYFTNNGSLILPFAFFAEWIDDDPANVVISVESMDAKVISDRIIYLIVKYASSAKNTSQYSLYKTTNGYRTRPMLKFRQFVEHHRKDISHFIHRKTFKKLWADFCVIAFIERNDEYEQV